MTAPLHHINQMILQMPTLNGYVSAHVAATEQLQRQARLEEARNLYRDTVEVVAAMRESVEILPLGQEKGERFWARRRRKSRAVVRKNFMEDSIDLTAVEAVVDVRV